MGGRLLPTHIQIQITKASISPLTRPTSDIRKDSGWACFRFEQVENAEVWNRSTETEVRKRKYGNRSTEGKEKLSMSSPASLGRLLNKAVSLICLPITIHHLYHAVTKDRLNYIHMYCMRHTAFWVTHPTKTVSFKTPGWPMWRCTLLTLLHGCMHRLGLVLCMLYMHCKGETKGWEAK